MDGALAWLYRHLGRLYIGVLVVFGLVEALAFSVIVVYVAVVRYLGLHAGAFAHVAIVAIAGIEVGTAIGTLAILMQSRAALAWMGGDKRTGQAAAAWADAVRLPTLHWRFAAPPIIAGATPVLLSMNGVAHPAFAQMAAIVFGSFTVVLLAVALHQVASETLLRPVLSEIDGVAPQARLDPRVRFRSIRFRIVGSSLLVIWISAFLASGLVSHAASPISQLTLTVVGGGFIALTFGLVFTLALSQTLFGPLRDLREAAKRVQQGDLKTRVKVVSNDEIGQMGASFNDMVIGLAERAALHSALGTYLDPTIADRLLAEGEVLKGEVVELSILFCDIVAFSTRVERMRPDHVVAELNEFFELVIPVVESYGGHTNKLLGDGFMALFGAPVPLADHADRAVAAGCEIQDKIWTKYAGEIRAGVGINSGTAIVGTTGGGRKLDFTVIGDAVNVASRVEALTRTTGDTILLTEATKLALVRAASLDPRGSVAIRGREEPTPLYSVVVRSRG